MTSRLDALTRPKAGLSNGLVGDGDESGQAALRSSGGCSR